MRCGLLIAVVMLAWAPLCAQNASAPIGGGHKFGIIAKAGAAIPVGEFSDLFTTGFAGYVEVPYDLNSALQLFASVGYTRFTVDAGKLNDELAASIKYPMPSLLATVSEITEPTKARVIATLSDAKK